MGAIHFSLDEKLLEFLTARLPLKLFVETGAFRGDSLALASRYISECRSVEMSPELFEKVRARFQGQPNIQVNLGDSPAFLGKSQADFAAQPVLFWLDAHWCEAAQTSGQSAQSPLLAELAALGKLHPSSVILIDDARLYLSAPPRPHRFSDWPDFHAVVTTLLALSATHRLMILNDVIVFYPGRIAAAMTDFAHENGADWLLINHLRKACEAREQERAERRFPSANYFRHLWHKLLKRHHTHAAH
jgi:hypothetical protein